MLTLAGSCSEAMSGITTAATTARDSIAATATPFSSGDVDDPAMSSTVADDFVAAATDMGAVAEKLSSLAGASSGDVANAAQAAAKKWAIASNDYTDLAAAVTSNDVAQISSLAGTASADMADSGDAFTSVVEALGSQLKAGEGCS